MPEPKATVHGDTQNVNNNNNNNARDKDEDDSAEAAAANARTVAASETATTTLSSSSSSFWQTHAHSAATAALCVSSFSNSFLMISIFPYAGYMAMYLLNNNDEQREGSVAVTTESAGLYAGMLSSIFMVGRLVLAYQWGDWADRYGRVVMLQIVLVLSAIFSILFGTSQTFTAAMVWRFCLGMSNGIVSTTKTAAQEIGYDNPLLERRAMGLVLGMRSWSLLMSPALAGFLAEPVQQYPDWARQLQFSWPPAYKMLVTYPFLLPNLLVAVLCVVGALSVRWCVPETLAMENRRYIWQDVGKWLHGLRLRLGQLWNRIFANTSDVAGEQKSLLPNDQKDYSSTDTATATAAKSTTTADEKDGAHQHDKDDFSMDSTTQKEPTAAVVGVWQRPLTRQHLILHWFFSFVTTYIDEAFPLFCLSSSLHLTEAEIGQILSGAGLLFAALQYVSFATLTHHLGLYKSLLLGCWVGTLPIALLPVTEYFVKRPSDQSTTAATNTTTTTISPSLAFSILLTGSLCMGISKLMHSLFFVSMAVAINKTVESHQRGKMNALGLTGSSVVKAGGPMLAGALVAFCFTAERLPTQFGGWIVFGVVPIMGIFVAKRVLALEEAVEQANHHDKTVDKDRETPSV